MTQFMLSNIPQSLLHSPYHCRAKVYKMQFKKEVKFGDMSPPAITKEPDKSGESSLCYVYIHKYCSSLLAVTESGLI